jgi:putative peptide zinc metalloprotease protein
MAKDLLSPSWYRVAALKPRLRLHTRVHRHEYRGERWYVIEDRISRRAHRFNAAAYRVVGLMNGRRSLQTIWEAVLAQLQDAAPTQDEIIRLLGQLHAADVMQCEISPDIDELLRRMQRTRRRGWMARALSPLAIRIPLFDPDRLLERGLPWYRPLFGVAGAVLWLAVVGWAAVAAAQQWDVLTQDITDRVLAPENLLIMGLVFPLIKALHEFGHACAVKAWGGEVHEMGIMLLVMMPIPYVDASSASAFPQKHRRVLVGAAGMIVELFVAALALFFWLDMTPGLLRGVLFNVMLIASVTTVLFNANPLLRFDGYYILADLVEMPNLRQRAMQYLSSIFQRRLFGIDTALPEAPLRERVWLALFAVASFVYRIFITFAIALFIATKYFLFGVLLAIWAVASAVVLPLLSLVAFLWASPRLRRNRARAVLASGVIVGALAALLFLVPLPLWTNAQGVIWVPEQSQVRPGADGFVERLLVAPGARVRLGEPLIALTDPELPLRIRLLAAQKRELELQYQADRVDSAVRAQITLDELKAVDADLKRATERAAELVVRSPADGTFVVAQAEDLPGRYLRHGEQVAYVMPQGAVTARVVVPQQSVDLVRRRTQGVGVMLADRVGELFPARVLREVPSASNTLPSLALATAGGGEVALDPRSERGAKTLETFFEFDLELLAGRPGGVGERVYVRFEHDPEPLAKRLYRRVRQLFLQRFVV